MIPILNHFGWNGFGQIARIPINIFNGRLEQVGNPDANDPPQVVQIPLGNQNNAPQNEAQNNRRPAANNEPEMDCLGPPEAPPDPQALKEAHGKIDRAMEQIRELFPDLALGTFLTKEKAKRRRCKNLKCSCTNEIMIVNALSDHILAYAHEFKKIHRAKIQNRSRFHRRNDSIANETVYETAAEIPYNAIDEEKLANFFEFIASAFETTMNDDTTLLKHKGNFEQCECYKWLQKTFLHLRCYVFQKLHNGLKNDQVGHRSMAVAITCFTIENEIIEREEFKEMRSVFLTKRSEINWDNMQNFLTNHAYEQRKTKFQNYTIKKSVEELDRKYGEFMEKLKTHFPEFFSPEGVFNKDLVKLGAIDEEDGPLFECAVCFEQYLVKYGVSCQPIESQEAEDNPDKPSTSRDDPKSSVHTFCRPCMRGHAQAATGEMPLAEGGVGLRYDIRNYLPRDVRTRLNERILEENLGMAQIEHLERCRKCNFAVEMDVPAEVNKVFHCLQCNYQFCRLCDEPWDKHFGYSCDEIKGHDKMRQDLEVKLNEAIVRKCPRCGVQFVKSEACNKMRCRCGLTMCYLCRTINIDYSHFCRCPRNPNDQNNACNCGKKCMLWENPEKKDREALRELMLSAPSPVRFMIN